MDELLGIAILAYRSGRYSDAIDVLSQIEKRQPTNWLAKMYLGITYQRAGQLSDAHRVFSDLTVQCTQEHLVQQAKNALAVIEANEKARNGSPRTTRNKMDKWFDYLAV
jgi:predicted Zn-dependent protease